jgi:hypothetical protein
VLTDHDAFTSCESAICNAVYSAATYLGAACWGCVHALARAAEAGLNFPSTVDCMHLLPGGHAQTVCSSYSGMHHPCFHPAAWTQRHAGWLVVLCSGWTNPETGITLAMSKHSIPLLLLMLTSGSGSLTAKAICCEAVRTATGQCLEVRVLHERPA